jgi:ADP-heptose:LPS heptosyltransferase
MAWSVDNIVEVEFPGFKRSTDSVQWIEPYKELRQAMRRLREYAADDALVLRDDAWWAAWLVRGAVGRHIVTGPDARTAAFATATSHSSPTTHRTAMAVDVVQRYLTLMSHAPASIDGLDMSPQLRGDRRTVDEALVEVDVSADHKPLIVVHPGSGAPVKSWSVRSWRQVIGQFADARVVITGSESERGVCAAICDGFEHATTVAGETTLPQLAALLQRADLALGTDNGQMHLAGAVGTPTVRLFGPSNPDRYGPWQGTTNQSVLSAGWTCPACENLTLDRAASCGCMAAIPPATVVERARGLLTDGT